MRKPMSDKESGLDYWPAFTSYADSTGRTDDGLYKDLQSLSVSDHPTVRPGDEITIKLSAKHPQGKRLRISGRVSRTDGDLGEQEVESEGTATFTWTFRESDIGAGIPVSFTLVTVDGDHHRIGGSKDQFLTTAFQVFPRR